MPAADASLMSRFADVARALNDPSTVDLTPLDPSDWRADDEVVGIDGVPAWPYDGMIITDDAVVLQRLRR